MGARSSEVNYSLEVKFEIYIDIDIFINFLDQNCLVIMGECIKLWIMTKIVQRIVLYKALCIKLILFLLLSKYEI